MLKQITTQGGTRQKIATKRENIKPQLHMCAIAVWHYAVAASCDTFCSFSAATVGPRPSLPLPHNPAGQLLPITLQLVYRQNKYFTMLVGNWNIFKILVLLISSRVSVTLPRHDGNDILKSKKVPTQAFQILLTVLLIDVYGGMVISFLYQIFWADSVRP